MTPPAYFFDLSAESSEPPEEDDVSDEPPDEDDELDEEPSVLPSMFCSRSSCGFCFTTGSTGGI
jgi:hypothetical protein